MVLERADLTAQPGKGEALHRMLADQAIPILRSITGVGEIRLCRCVEAPDRFMLLVEWDSVDAHHAFYSHAIYPEFRALFPPVTQDGAMDHYETL
ncbi:antibiotic biosynthesis monooxygenase family protein [Stakelama tenebrarum]|uniref:Antibiotic biosynthesis monooxygenase n=1 Tax=Stakelama tenebrarum TaxID=2711215 RepID=A0A6G6Y444_9SPHN|nr:antibiotic biosynthesis monooxygenase family protein [Sphingosinithalassobacter tenebrarum]QIG79702.1 antibiotic biosynthesis monooxygenase [Sphingosinithalassobacter tenebrarum]